MIKGIALAHVGRHQEALCVYEAALGLKPDRPDFLLAIGNTIQELGRLESALAVYERGLRLAPDLVELWLGKGNTLFWLGLYPDALRAYERGLELAPRDGRLWQGKGNVLRCTGRLREALLAYQKGLQSAPCDPHLLTNVGDLLAQQGQYSEALRVVERGLATNMQPFGFWFLKARIRSRISPLHGQQYESVVRCLNRGVLLCNELPEFGWRVWRRMIISEVSKHVHAPLLLHRLVSLTPLLATAINCRWLIEATDAGVRPILNVLDWLETGASAQRPVDRLLMLGRLQLQFGDAPAALGTLDELDDVAPNNLTGQLYLAWAMHECLCDVSAQTTSAASIAREALANAELSPRGCFDAGHILMLDGDLPEAASAFDRGATEFVPARIMAAYCHSRLGSREKSERHLTEWLEYERRQFNRGLRGFIIELDPPLIDMSKSEDLAALERVFERFECTEALGAWRMDGTLDDHPIYQELVSRLGGGLDEWMGEYDRRMRIWANLYEDRDALKKWRSVLNREWVEKERSRVREGLDWLGFDDSHRFDVLTKTISDRIYGASTIPNPLAVLDSIRLLFADHRLPADYTVMLLLYTACRAADLDGRSDGHARQFAKHGIAATFGLALTAFGFSDAIETFGRAISLGLVGDILVDHLDVWLRHRRTEGRPFPRFERFRAELIEYCEQYRRRPRVQA